MRRLAFFLASVSALYALAAADIAFRARRAYAEGEKYMSWHSDPAKKRAYHEAIFLRRQLQLHAQRSDGLSEDEFQQKLVLARAEQEYAVSESSLKYAVRWFQTASDLFSPPENRWVRLSRQRLKEARAFWKQELDAAKIPYQEAQLR